MTAITADVVRDSISSAGIRLTTVQLCFPRSILAELNTHRVFSRNARSSRAVPVNKIIEEVKRHPFVPVYWGRNQAGMQARSELSGFSRWLAQKVWRGARYPAIWAARLMMAAGAHKQIVNRLLEPWMWTHVLVTSTQWANFFALRCHEDAEPHIQILARAIHEARGKSKPQELAPGEWHLPFVSKMEERKLDDIELAVKISVARCARVCVTLWDGTCSTIDNDLRLYEKLVGGFPIHASPAEHQATPDTAQFDGVHDKITWDHPELHGNFYGWNQNRKYLDNECVRTYMG